MAKTNYPEELTNLVEEYLTDGIISAKERQVLLNKAEKLGVDVDEFDLYIDAQQQKVDQAVDSAAAKKRGKTCPFCGGTLPQLSDKCPHCGETVTVEASEELQEIFNYLEDALVDFKSGKDVEKNKAIVERYVRKASMYYENNPKVKKLLAEVQEESEKAADAAKKNARKKTIVSILTYNKKLTAGIAVGIIIAIVWGIWSAIKDSPEDDAASTTELVNQAISAGDVEKAWTYCEAYKQKHEKTVHLIFGAYDAIIKAQTSKVNELVESGDLSSADKYLKELTFRPYLSGSDLVEKYDAMFFSVINAYIQNGDLDSAESLGLVWKSRIGYDLKWEKSSCYKTLKSKFKSANKDFSALKSEYDYEELINK